MSRETEVRLPREVGVSDPRALFAFVRSVDDTQGDLRINAEDVEWFDPLGLAVLGASCERN